MNLNDFGTCTLFPLPKPIKLKGCSQKIRDELYY